MAGTISIRKSIRWIPGPACEPTRTMVLTSPQGRFVDVRVLKKGEADGAVDDAEARDRSGHLPFARLDWAIAGTSTSTIVRTPDETIRRCRFEHWLDSRTATPDAIPPDEGDMFPLADGLTLEKGRMVNPDTGVDTDYEEVWRDENVERGTEQECVVLRYDGYEDGIGHDIDERRGMIVKLGGHAQGFIKSRGEMAVGRWKIPDHEEESEAENEAEDDKQRPRCVVRMGRVDWLPGGQVFSRRFSIGEQLQVGPLLWVVVEAV
ncbi:hypothetical protein E4U32_003758 [Claviceps aff. humidiphila group G2b]|nr:hypothetical protein E4U32_003758 [Claviceps aff. humidiphila group G2b]